MNTYWLHIKSSSLLAVGLFIGSCLYNKAQAQTTKKPSTTQVEAKDPVINWEAYDPASSVAKTAIKYETLGGFWKAQKEVYRADVYTGTVQLTRPAVLEAVGKTYRRDIEQPLEKYTINNNLIIQLASTGADTGVINKITLHELTISWKSKGNYTRYYYTK